jgi:hypothetical protein
VDGPDTANASDKGDLGNTRTLSATVCRWTQALKRNAEPGRIAAV